MMKKLLALILVLGLMTSMANANLQISVNNEPEPIDSEIILTPSETVILDIWTDADIMFMELWVWMIVCDTTGGTITGGVAMDPWTTVSGRTQDFPSIIPPEGEEGIWGNSTNLDYVPIVAGTVLVDDLVFHCEGAYGDLVIHLYEAPDGSPPQVLYDSVVIHQIPEPTTIALLGFGGLFLLRRRR